MKNRKISLIDFATLFGLGYLPFPGIIGTLIGLTIGLFLKMLIPGPYYVFIVAVLVVAVIYVFEKYGEKLLDEDTKEVIIDEVVGFLLVTVAINEPLYILLAFVIFRIIDNFKPYPIKRVEKNSRLPFRVFLDDIIAGLYSILIISLLQKI